VSVEEIGREQEHVSKLYARLDSLRRQMSARLDQTLMGTTGGTHQARGERDVAASRCTEQLARYSAVENGLCFGRLDVVGGERRYIGRIGLFDDTADYEPLLIDWRAHAARSFYVATAASPDGVWRRRHIRTVRRTVVELDDEVLDLSVADPRRREGVTGEAALLAAVTAGRTGRMHDIVATIQAEQDRIIRSDLGGVLVVQGGPGTGKTAVALHRAAYLLYTHREQLASRAVLIVGPNETFLRYIGQVLPSLGETSVVLSTVADLYPGIRARRAEPPTVSEIKGRLMMADVVAAAVADRQRVPDEQLEIVYDDEPLLLTQAACEQARARARRSRLPHNQARAIFVEAMIDALARRLADRTNDAIVVPDLERAVDAALADDDLADGTRELFDEADLAEMRRELRASAAVRAALDELWPVVTPQRLLADLFSSPQRLETAATRLPEWERAALLRPVGGGWAPADVPLLDEAAHLLGDDDQQLGPTEEDGERERAIYARGVLEILHGSRSLDDEDAPEMLMAQDLMDAGRLADRHAVAEDLTVAERAAADRRWAYGHVVVDEAQELSEMAWRVLMRRCPTHSMTLVGDVAQTSDLAGASSWDQVLGPYLDDRWRMEPLTVNYRMPAEVMAVAEDVLRRLDLSLEPPRSVRETGVAPWRRDVSEVELAGVLGEIVQSEVAKIQSETTDAAGRVAVLVPAGRVTEVGAAVRAAVPDVGIGAGAPGRDPSNGSEGNSIDLERSVVVLDVRQAKGLEFDSVIIVDPVRIIGESRRGLNDLYVALTRATRRLGVVYHEQLPDVLKRLVPWCAAEHVLGWDAAGPLTRPGA
jgi:DNA helicase IV